MENALGFSGFPGFKTVSESAKQTKQENHNSYKEYTIYRRMWKSPRKWKLFLNSALYSVILNSGTKISHVMINISLFWTSV